MISAIKALLLSIVLFALLNQNCEAASLRALKSEKSSGGYYSTKSDKSGSSKAPKSDKGSKSEGGSSKAPKSDKGSKSSKSEGSASSKAPKSEKSSSSGYYIASSKAPKSRQLKSEGSYYKFTDPKGGYYSIKSDKAGSSKHPRVIKDLRAR